MKIGYLNWVFILFSLLAKYFGFLWIEFPFALIKIFSEGKASKIDEFVITEKKNFIYIKVSL